MPARPPRLEAQRATSAAADGRNHSDWRFLQSRQWREVIRPAVLRRDNHLCGWCRLLGRVVKAEQVDHIIRPHGDKQLQRDPTNLRSLCTAHHALKTGWERRETRPRLLRIGCGADGWPRDVDPLEPGREVATHGVVV